MSRVPQYGRINVAATLLDAPVQYRQNVITVPLGSIVEDSPFQKRRKFDPETFEDDRLLVESIRELGQWGPVCLQVIEQGRYRTVYGHRRIAALRCLKAETALAFIIQGDLTKIATWTAIENTGMPLSSLEKAELAQHFSAQLTMKTAEISIRLGVSPRHVQRLLKIATATDEVRLALSQAAISAMVAYEVALAPKEHQARLVAIAIDCHLQPSDCVKIAKRLSESAETPDEAAGACGFAASLQSGPKAGENTVAVEVEEISGAADISDGDERVADSPKEAVSLLLVKGEPESNHGSTPDAGQGRAKLKFDPSATTKMLQNELTTVDKVAVQTIVAQGADRRLNQRDLRVAVLLAPNATPSKALDNAEALTNDPTAKSLADIAVSFGRVRDRVQRRQHTGLTASMLRVLAKECLTLASEADAAQQ
jgi:ParB/RepB/Spo0J family partition protein